MLKRIDEVLLFVVVLITASMGAYSLYIYAANLQISAWILLVLIGIGFYSAYGLLTQAQWGAEWALAYFTLQVFNVEVHGQHYFIFTGVSWLWPILDHPWRVQLNLFAVLMVICSMYSIRRHTDREQKSVL